MHSLVRLNYQCVVLTFLILNGQLCHEELEPMPMATKPIPLIVNKSQNSDQASTDQRQMTEDTTANPNEDDDYESDQDNNQPLQLNWLPPPPPPPSMALASVDSFDSLPFQEHPGLMSGHRLGLNRHRKDELTLFLVILTIAGFFGLIISMFMPFTMLLSQGGGLGFGGINGLQPAIVPATALGGFPGTTTMGVGGMGVGKRRKRSGGDNLRAIKALHQTFYYLKAKVGLRPLAKP